MTTHSQAARESFHDLSATVWERLEEVLERFEDAWRAGGRPALEDYLTGTGPERKALLIELVHAELHYRLKAGEVARVEEYLGRHPELRDDPRIPLGLILAEHRLRRQQEPDLTADDYLRRFPQYAGELPGRLAPPPSSLPGDGESGVATVIAAGSPGGTDAHPGAALPGHPGLPGYDVLGELGRGGMGVVYKARHRALNRFVALKMILAGGYVGRQERFRAEAEAIARLQHPHVVQIHEVGEHDGQPYFALEFVEGGNLADKLTGIPWAASPAAALVETLARAMHAAHQRGIVHRDLKPANVLLTAEGTPKVTDFGLAKRLDDDKGQTQSDAILGTPSYMAPEQTGGRPREVGPASDVYALGAILYECLTGRPPFRGVSVLETLEQVRRQEPVPPRQLQPHVPRDLETICLKCLEKAPAKRYLSAEELADDLRRFQQGEPIRARPTPLWERARKWARRRPAAAALVFTSLGAAAALAAVVLVYTTRLQAALDQARHEQARAEANLEKANDAVETYLSAVTDDPLLKERDLRDLRRRLLESGLPFYRQLSAEQPDEPRPRAARARALNKLGRIAQEIGERDEAQRNYEQAIAAFEGLAREYPAAAEHRAALAEARSNLGSLQANTGHRDEARSAFQTARALFEQLARDEPDNPRHRLGLGRAYVDLGSLDKDVAGRQKAAEASYLKALELLGPLAEQHPDVADYRREKASALSLLGRLYFFDFVPWRLTDAAAAIQKAHDGFADLARQYPHGIEYRYEQALSAYNLGLVHQVRKELAPAEDAFREALKVHDELVRGHPLVVEFRVSLASTYMQLGALDEKRDRAAEAAENYNKALALHVELAARDPNVPRYLWELGEIRTHLGALASQAGGNPAAIGWYDKALADIGQAARLDERSANVRRAKVRALSGRAEALTKAGRHTDALKDWDEVVALDAGLMHGMYRLERATARARVGDHRRAVAEADEIAEEDSAHVGAMYAYQAAVVHAVAARTVRADRAIPEEERGHLAERYAARAVGLLKKVQEAGNIDAGFLRELRQGEEFAALRDRSDFQAVRRQCEASAAGQQKP